MRKKDIKPNLESKDGIGFKSAEEAWFWFVSAQTARNEGAKISSGEGEFARPCEPLDIARALNRLRLTRRVSFDQLKVLVHYGVRHLPPDPTRPPESMRAVMWEDAMTALQSALVARGIVAAPPKPTGADI